MVRAPSSKSSSSSRIRAWSTSVGLALTASLVFAAHCSQTPTQVAVRTFEGARKVDVLCMHVYEGDPNVPDSATPIPPEPAPQAACAPVPASKDGTFLPYHLFALVTQATRGELAVVDLTAQKVIDEDGTTPGINFLPVGSQPTDVSTTPDGKMAFVASAEANKAAIYGIPSTRILGDSQVLPKEQTPPAATINSWPVCGLPEAPQAVRVVPRSNSADAPATTADETGASGYDLVVVLPGNANRATKIVTLDPAPFLRGAGMDSSPGDTLAPGSLAPCPILGAIELRSDVPAVGVAARTWDDGLPYAASTTPADGGLPEGPGSCSGPVTNDAGTNDAGTADAGTNDAGSDDGGTSDASSTDDAGSPDAAVDDAGNLIGAKTSDLLAHAGSVALAGRVLYVGDVTLPLVHVVDLSKPTTPQELAPLVATSANEPERVVTVGDIAVSPPTRDYRRFLYAVDQRPGNMMVYDVTEPPRVPTPPQTRPHAELNPFQPPDRIVLPAPVAAVSFIRHDFLLTLTALDCTSRSEAARSGLLCNPNPNAVGPDRSVRDYGVFYRANVCAAATDVLAWPARLRGIFVFATMTNGRVATLDVDDWDAPCRRPDPINAEFVPNGLAPLQPAPTGPDDLDPYHVPVAFDADFSVATPVSLEAFYPVSAPHRPRSAFVLRNDPQGGNHIPGLLGLPQLLGADGTLPTTGPDAVGNPVMLPTATRYADPSYDANPTEPNPANRTVIAVPVARELSMPNILGDPTKTANPSVRFSWEDPTVHLDQEWDVSYEGVLPGFDGLSATIQTTDGDQTAVFSNPRALFCRRGIEDTRIGIARARAVQTALVAAKLPELPRLDHRVGDYVSIKDEILPIDDPYWREDGECWDSTRPQPFDRHQFCEQSFGAAADGSVERDFPILEAYDDHLVVGRFGYAAAADGATVSHTTSNREIVGKHESNVPIVKAMRCCFHKQARFNVRTGGEWSMVGGAVGFLHHVKVDAATNACVLSCDPNDALLNARILEIPRATVPQDVVVPERNSVLALRNPMFSFIMWAGQSPANKAHVITPRGESFRFNTRGQFVPIVVGLVPSSESTSVSPQSMKFIPSLGQLAVVDGASQGLVLIDLDGVKVATRFF
ncbi:MAG: hypothetical protein U0169_26100 [Polyangiaceae bacterium]